MHPFRRAVESHDLRSATEILAENVVFRSPIVFRTYEGRDAVIGLLEVVVEVLQDFRYTDEITNGSLTILVFEARVGDKQIQGIDMLRSDDSGRVTEFTVMVRPLSATLAFAEMMKARLTGAA